MFQMKMSEAGLGYLMFGAKSLINFHILHKQQESMALYK